MDGEIVSGLGWKTSKLSKYSSTKRGVLHQITLGLPNLVDFMFIQNQLYVELGVFFFRKSTI